MRIKMLRYVINLDRSPDRWFMVSEKLKAFDIHAERISAVDGHGLSRETLVSLIPPLEDISKINCPRELLPGEIGCFLSHKKCWQKLTESENENWALIMEDDIEISSRAKNYMTNTDWIPEGIDLIQLHIWGSTWKSKVDKSFTLPNGDNLLRPLNPPALGTQAYLISKKAATDALSLSKTICSPVDNFLSGIYSPFAKKYPTYRLNPAIVTTTDLPSSIDAKQYINKLPFSKKIKNHPLRRLLRLKHQIIYTLFGKEKVFIFK